MTLGLLLLLKTLIFRFKLSQSLQILDPLFPRSLHTTSQTGNRTTSLSIWNYWGLGCFGLRGVINGMCEGRNIIASQRAQTIAFFGDQLGTFFRGNCSKGLSAIEDLVFA